MALKLMTKTIYKHGRQVFRKILTKEDVGRLPQALPEPSLVSRTPAFRTHLNLEQFAQRPIQNFAAELRQKAAWQFQAYAGSGAVAGRGVGIGQKFVHFRLPMFALVGFSMTAGQVATINQDEAEQGLNNICDEIKGIFHPVKEAMVENDVTEEEPCSKQFADFDLGRLIGLGCHSAVYSVKPKNIAEEPICEEVAEEHDEKSEVAKETVAEEVVDEDENVERDEDATAQQADDAPSPELQKSIYIDASDATDEVRNVQIKVKVSEEMTLNMNLEVVAQKTSDVVIRLGIEEHEGAPGHSIILLDGKAGTDIALQTESEMTNNFEGWKETDVESISTDDGSDIVVMERYFDTCLAPDEDSFTFDLENLNFTENDLGYQNEASVSSSSELKEIPSQGSMVESDVTVLSTSEMEPAPNLFTVDTGYLDTWQMSHHSLTVSQELPSRPHDLSLTSSYEPSEPSFEVLSDEAQVVKVDDQGWAHVEVTEPTSEQGISSSQKSPALLEPEKKNSRQLDTEIKLNVSVRTAMKSSNELETDSGSSAISNELVTDSDSSGTSFSHNQLLPANDETVTVPSDPDEAYNHALKVYFNYCNDLSSTERGLMRLIPEAVLAQQLDDRTKQLLQRSTFRASHPFEPHPNIAPILAMFIDDMPELPDAEEKFPCAISRRLTQCPNAVGGSQTVLQLMPRYDMTLRDYLQEHTLSVQDQVLLFCQLLEAVAHLNKYNVAHRDIKDNNILVTLRDGSPHLVLADFSSCLLGEEEGLRIHYTSDQFNLGGNAALMAPEIVTAKPGWESILDYGKTDIWAAATIAYQIFGMENPFYGLLDSATYRDGDLPSLPDHAGVFLNNLVRLMLSREPCERPDVRTVMDCLHLYLWMPETLISDDDNIAKQMTTLASWITIFSAVTYCQSAAVNSTVKSLELQLKMLFLAQIEGRRLQNVLELYHVLNA